MKENRGNFSGKLGVIAVAAGSAVGLGNIWRFPYIAGQNGGGAFLIVYLIFVFLIGVPVMLSEFAIGRRAGCNAYGTFKKLSPKGAWWLVGLMGILAAIMIFSFYGTVAGWTLEYVKKAICDEFAGQDLGALSQSFGDFTTSPTMPLVWMVVFVTLTALIILGGVEKGIEKVSKFLMPLLFVLIIAVCIRAVTLPNASKGLEFLFKPDWSSLTFKGVLMALGQAAFSLSIGMGTMITYGSYIKKDTPLTATAIEIASCDTIVALLGAIMVFPTLAFLGAESTGGPGLVFITLPAIFQAMPGGYIFAILFFLLLSVAALTSTISLLEVPVSFLVDEFNMSRRKATLISSSVIVFLGVFCTLSFGLLSDFTIFGKTVFDLFDYTTANIMLTFGALLIVIYVGWFFGRKNFIEELTAGGKGNVKFAKFISILVKFVAPVGIGLVAIGSLVIGGIV
ncbi:MAG: sodium-dependent transporter [Bacteroidales bacterium]|nr:sodium-dependent transporter [Bacteroidales bacterium]